MFILNQYQTSVSLQYHLTDEEFLILQIEQLANIFRNEIIAIKDSNLDYIAISDKFFEAFEIKRVSEGLANKIQVYTGKDSDELDNPETLAQEELILTDYALQNSIYFFKSKNQQTHFMMRKRPLINPGTGKIVGILIIATPYKIGALRKLYIKQLLHWSKPNKSINATSLTKQQQQIAFCLLLGFHSRKEIAAILNNITNQNFNETRIKNGLKALYEKFDCNTPGQLIDVISNNEIDLDLSIHSLTPGNYIIY